MIKEILSVFKSNTLMDRAFQRSYDMLDLTYKMYLQAKEVLRHTEHTDIEVDITDEDIEVNKYQREVRKDVFNHLVLTEGEQLSSGLVLISIVIDLERIGDYTKNIVEIAQNHPDEAFTIMPVRLENCSRGISAYPPSSNMICFLILRLVLIN